MPGAWRNPTEIYIKINALAEVVDVVAPFGGAEDMVHELKAKVFPKREIHYVRLDSQGKTVAVA